MFSAVQAAQKQRATVAGPPAPMMTSGVDVSQGVEQQARARREMAGPQPTMLVNGVQRFNAPASPPPAMMPPAAAPMQAAQMMPAPASQPPTRMAAVNPLGGMDARPLSARGGPMSYSQQGEGTTNPNAFRVGQNNAPLGMRLLERAARRRDPRAIMQLAGMEQQNVQNAQQMGMMQMREAGDAQRFGLQQQQQQTMFEQQQTAMQMRDATNFDQQKQIMEMQNQQRAGESAVEFQRRQDAEAAQRAADSIVGDATIQVPGGFVPAVRTAGGQVRMAGGFMTAKTPDAPLPEGLVPQRAMRGGVEYGPAETAQTGKAPAFTYEKDPNGKITGAVYPVQDPQTGAWKLQRADLNGDGVVSPQEAAAASGAAAAPVAGQAVKTKGGNSYTFK